MVIQVDHHKFASTSYSAGKVNVKQMNNQISIKIDMDILF